jgi:hypothetical protein
MSVAEDWLKGHKQHSDESALRVENGTKCLRLLKEFAPFDKVVDFGCGIGAWLLAAQGLGATEILGLEGPWILDAETVISKGLIRIVDLATESVNLEKRYDLALTIEVAEHLPEQAADRFCASLVAASDRILFSAAIPKQGGIGHVNEQPLMYWVEKFWRLGYVPLEAMRPYLASDRAIYPWLRQNLIMFVSYSVLVRTPEMLRFARPLSDFALRYPC